MNRVIIIFWLVLALPLSAHVPLPHATRTVFNSIGKPERTYDKLGRSTRYYYDAKGNLVQTLYPDGTITRTVFDPNNRPIYTQDRHATNNGATLGTTIAPGTHTVYGPAGQILASERLAGLAIVRAEPVAGVSSNALDTAQAAPVVLSVTENQYDPYGLLLATVDARQNSTGFTYDSAGRRQYVYDQNGNTTANAYDLAGNLTSFKDALAWLDASRTVTNVYDELNRRIITRRPDGTFSRTWFDELGRRAAETDAAGHTTWFQQDALGRLTNVIDTLGQQTRYRYNALGHLLEQTDALGHTTKFAYDKLGQRIARTLPGGQSEGNVFDADGNLIASTNFNGLVVTNLCDAQNRLLSQWHGSTQLVAFTYNAAGRRATMADAGGTTTYAYDARGLLITNATPQGRLMYAYDEAGNLTNTVSSTAGGTAVGYAYDLLNRLATVVDNGLTGLPGNNTTYNYNVAGNLKRCSYPNGVTNLYEFDALHRLTNLTWKTGSSARASFAYGLSTSGQRTNLVETVGSTSRSFAWNYDPLNRLVSEDMTGGTTGALGYGYDPAGNRTNRTSNLAGLTNQAFSYNSNDWLTIDTYDKAGNTRTNGANAFLYDYANRLTNAVLGSTNVSILYNGDGQRVWKRVVIGTTTNTTIFLVDERNPTGYAQVLEEKSVVGTTTNLVSAYTYGLDLISRRQIAPVLTTFYGYDGHGSVRFLTGTNGTISDTYTFDAYGTLITTTGNTTNAFLYAGERLDTHLGVYDLRSRFLNPNTGRFVTMDSYEGRQSDPLSLHKYLYCHANPVNSVDPSGMDPLSAAINGQQVHRIIARDFRFKVPGGVSGPWVSTILRRVTPPGTWIPTIPMIPDLVDIPKKEVYEIKPIPQWLHGQLQLAGYIATLNYFDPAKGWKGGNTYLPPSKIYLRALAWAIVYPPSNGVIMYDVIDVPSLVLVGAATVATVFKADLALTTGLATINSLLGAP